ncbi:MAG TPA: Crp/Fnr family transcriptional regulator [Acidobacteriaceae bacterium]|jgi:CRP-like cAMP-binding protein
MSTNHNNRFLSSLSAESQNLLLSKCTPVPLPAKAVLYRAEEIVEHAYFLTSGLASVVSEMVDGGAVEVGMHGHEGVAGGLQVLGTKRSPVQCLMQVGGDGLRIPMRDLRSAVRASEEIRDALLEFVQTETLILTQVAACHRLHDAEERLARWLLMAQDRTGTEVLDLTQEFLAEMLGSRRATVTVIAGTLQRSGLIDYHRGQVTILDRSQMEEAACDCYRIIRNLRVESETPASALRRGWR